VVLANQAAKREARKRPTGVAMVKPAFRLSSRTPGVASAWSPRNPALVRKASETRKSRASDRREAASLVSAPIATLTSEMERTSQK
jgi:hypothetical protein